MAPTEFEISTDRDRIDVDLVHEFLSTSSYWAKGRTRAVVERCIDNSLCFGAYRSEQQVGFCRVITDYAVAGYVLDMFVVPECRGRGVGKMLVRAILEHPDLQGLQALLLRTRDAKLFYAPFGFGPVPRPEELLGRYPEDLDLTAQGVGDWADTLDGK